MDKKRSIQQNKALHKYFTELAFELNQRGIEPEVFMKGFRVNHTPESIKEIFKSVANHKFQKDSTTMLTTYEMNEVLREFDRHIAQFGVYMLFPSLENQNLIEKYNL